MLRRLNLNDSPLVSSFSSSPWTLNFRLAPVRTDLVVSSSFSSGDSNTDTRRMFSLGPLSRRFLRVSRLTGSAGSSSSQLSPMASVEVGSGLKEIGCSLSYRDTGGGPMSGDWLSGSSSTCRSSSALLYISPMFAHNMLF